MSARGENKSRRSNIGGQSLAMRAAGCLSAVTLLLAGCGAHTAAPQQPFVLNIAHINDHHSNLADFPLTDGSPVELTLEGVPTQVELGGFARVSAVFNSLGATPNLLKLHAGDAITGTLYHMFFKGEADAAMMNTICFDAFIPGNHEFDEGDQVLANFLDYLGRGSCKTPTLSANVVPQVGTPLAPTAGTGYLQPYLVKEMSGVKVGIVGITVSGKTMNASRPLASTQFLNEASSAQAVIDKLKVQGVSRIVLLTHQGYDADMAMAAQLTDVDVIIGGDSHSLLGDFSALGLSAVGPYPSVAKNKSGETVCIGQAWEYAKAIGLMRVEFNSDGSVKSCAGSASLVIGENFRRKDATGAWQNLSEAERQALVAKLGSLPSLKSVAPATAAAQVLAGFSSQVDAKKSDKIGTLTESLCLVRVPGTNRDATIPGCESASLYARGSDAAQVVAAAFLNTVRDADIGMVNGGGVRIALAAGTVTFNTAFTLLPFENSLYRLSLSGAEVLATLEDGVANYLDAGNSNGSHPYAAGLRWALDLSKPRGQRFSNVQAQDQATRAWSAIDAGKTYALVTIDYLALGSEGYTSLNQVRQAGRYVDLYTNYRQAFIDYVGSAPLGRPQRGDYSHQSVTTQSGSTLDPS